VSFLIPILLAFITATAWAQQAPIVVGAAVSQTGALAVLAADYRKALLLWQDELNGAGGLLGRRVELRLHDDESDARLAGELYAQLIREKADLLIGPYGSAATLMAGAEAERAQRVLINGAGSSLAVHKRAPQYVFQSAISNSAYGIGILAVAKSAGHQSLLILARDDLVSREMAHATRERAMKQGFTTGEIAIYRGSEDDFAPLIAKASAAGIDGWIAFGELRDTADMLRSFRKLGYAPRLFFARRAAEPKLIDLVGQDAEFALAAKEYDANFATPGNDRFAAAFATKWSARPGLAAAEGYTAATVLADAVRRAGTLDQAKLRAVLAQMETPTVLGGYKVDPQSGEQTAATPVVLQIHKGRPRPVWPPALPIAMLQPYPQWSERQRLK
jgi:branched-chain amino acid transport system substrate-binding protein